VSFSHFLQQQRKRECRCARRRSSSEDIGPTMNVFSWALVAAASLQSVAAFSVSRPAISPPGSSVRRMSDNNDDWWKKEYDPTGFNNQGGKKKSKDADQSGDENFGNLFYKGKRRGGGGTGRSPGAGHDNTPHTSRDTSSPWPTTAKNRRRNATDASAFEAANQEAMAKEVPVAKGKEVLEGQDDNVAPEMEEVFWQVDDDDDDANNDPSVKSLQSPQGFREYTGPPDRLYQFDDRENAFDGGPAVKPEQTQTVAANIKSQDYWGPDEDISDKDENEPPQTYLYQFDKRENAVDGGPAAKFEQTQAVSSKSQDYWGPGPGVNRGVLEVFSDDESSPAATVQSAEASSGRVSHASDTSLRAENARLRQELSEARAEMKRLKRAINTLTSEV
jgi:hypothetical protein